MGFVVTGMVESKEMDDYLATGFEYWGSLLQFVIK